MTVELNTLVCPIITPDTYGTGFQYNVSDDSWDDFKTLLCDIGATYIKTAIRETKDFKKCPIKVSDKLVSPSQYNYVTDSIDFSIEVSPDIIETLKNDRISEQFLKYIKRFGSHSGFISNYPTTEKEVLAAFDAPGSRKFELLLAEFIMYEIEYVMDLEAHQRDYLDEVIDEAFENDYLSDDYVEGVQMAKVRKVTNMVLEGKTLREAMLLKESIDNDKIQALLQFLDKDPDDEDEWNKVGVESYNDNVYYYDSNHDDFLICTDEEADEEFETSIENLVDDIGLDAFSGYARDHIVENYCDEDVINEYYQNDVRAYAEDINTETDPVEVEVEDENGDMVTITCNNRLFGECLENDIIAADDFTTADFDEDGDYIGDKDLVELYCDHFQTPADQGYDSGYEWLEFSFGKDFANKFIEDNDAIDWEGVVEYVKSEDGRGGELNSYDGKEYEEEVNGTTYYIYPNCDFEELKD